MRFSPCRSGSPILSSVPAVLVLALNGCGGGGETAASATPPIGGGKVAAAPEKPAPLETPAPAVEPRAESPTVAAKSAQPAGSALQPTAPPPERPRDQAPVLENEPAVDKPISIRFPEPPPPAEAPALADLPPDDPVLGKPLVINGKVIPFDAVRAQACLGAEGVAEIEKRKLFIYIDEEIERRRQAGADPSQLGVTEEEVAAFEKELSQMMDPCHEGTEGTLTWNEGVLGNGNPELQDQLRLTKLFYKLFLPDDPGQWPPITLETFQNTPGGKEILEYYQGSWEQRQATDDPPPRNAAERSFDSAMLQQIIDYLHRLARVEVRPAPGVLCKINGVDIGVDEIWKKIEPRFGQANADLAKRWLAVMTLLRESLQEAGAWLGDEEAEAAYHAESDPFKDSIFSIERLAVIIKRYPSVEAYKEHQRAFESFKRMIASEMTPEALERQKKERTSKIASQVTCDVDVILCSAFDLKTNRWKENGWADAKRRMQEVVRLLSEEGRPWDEVLEANSDFVIPPPESGQQNPNQPQKGRFRNIQRNPLLTELGESEYWHFLNGSSVTDFVFFQQEVGTLGDPMLGPYGWYLPRLVRRSKPPMRSSVKPEVMASLVQEDYLICRLNSYVQDLLERNQVYGLEDVANETAEGVPPAERSPAAETVAAPK